MPSLSDLPTEVLRQICGQLPCQSALDFLLVSRSIYLACDDWSVWRDVVQSSDEFSFNQTGAVTILPQAWKQYVVAAACAPKNPESWTTKDLEQWIPQLAFVGCTKILQSWPGDRYCDCLHVPESHDTRHPYHFANVELQDWHLAQAAAFSIAMQVLSTTRSRELAGDMITLRSHSWSPIVSPNEAHTKVLAMRYAVANRAVGILCTRLRHTLGAGIFQPPTTATIPFLKLMKVPAPFSSDDLAYLSTCHLPVMADPEFFVGDEWTGTVKAYDKQTFVDHDGFDPYLIHPGEEYIPYGRDSEGMICFRLVGTDQGDQSDEFVLESNNFHSQMNLHRLTITVQRSTGYLRINHWHCSPHNQTTTEGLITPFGIMSPMPRSKEWMWLWKADWSERL